MSAHVMTVEGVPCILSVTRDMTDYKAAEEQIDREDAAQYF